MILNLLNESMTWRMSGVDAFEKQKECRTCSAIECLLVGLCSSHTLCSQSVYISKNPNKS